MNPTFEDESIQEEAASRESVSAGQMRTERVPRSVLMGAVLVIVIAYLVTTFPGFTHPKPWSLIWGAWFTPAINEGEFWRLVTPILLHANLTHLLSNLFGLWVFGRQIEPFLGVRNMLSLFATALLSSDLTMYAADMLQEAWVPAYFQVPSIGASGIVAGVIAANITFVILIRRQTHSQAFKKDLLGVFLLLVAYVSMDIMATNVNLWAHLGGYLGGVLYALIYHRLLMARADRLVPGEMLETSL